MLASLFPALQARSSAGPSGSLHDSKHLVPAANRTALGSLQTLMFHVHKAGGSSLCDMARRNGEIVSTTNCNMGDSSSNFGFSCDRDQASTLPAEDQGSFIKTVRYTFGADECLAPREPVAGLLTLTSLREPLERAASHFYYDAQWGYAQKAHGDCRSFDCFVLQRMESDDYVRYYWHNYMTRFFSGTAHTGAIGAEELERAKARLAGVDVLIDLANFDASMAMLKDKLNWDDLSLPHENSSGGGTRTVEMSPEAHAKLTEANQLDVELYEHYRLAAARQHAGTRGQQAARVRVAQAPPAPELERAFYNDSVRIVVTGASKTGDAL